MQSAGCCTSLPTILEPVEDDIPDTTRVLPAESEDADEVERSLIGELRARHIESLRLRCELAELVRERTMG